MSMTSEIKEYALNIGYSKVGITSADNFDDFAEELLSRGSIYDFYVNGLGKPLHCAVPKNLLENAKSIIVMVLDYAQKSFPEALTKNVGRLYQARSYNPPEDTLSGARFKLMKDFLTSRDINISTGHFIPERWAGARAGVTNFGRNTFAYADGIGSFIVLHSIIVDVELDYDEPTLTCKCPEGCDKCMQACPTSAIYAPFKLNPLKCVAFNNFMTNEKIGNGVTYYIPKELRDKMGQHIHGCDICQEACPRNGAKLKNALPKDPYLEDLSAGFTLEKLLAMPDGFFEKSIRPIMYNYVRNPRMFQRNAAVAIGNTKDKSYIPLLEAQLSNEKDFVRAHVAWALGQIGGEKANDILKRRLGEEPSEIVRTEIKEALLGASLSG